MTGPTPTVAFVTPTDGSTVPLTFDIIVAASETGGSIAHVDIDARGQSLGTLTAAPYKTHRLTAPQDGQYELTATAYDTAGNFQATIGDLHRDVRRAGAERGLPDLERLQLAARLPEHAVRDADDADRRLLGSEPVPERPDLRLRRHLPDRLDDGPAARPDRRDVQRQRRLRQRAVRHHRQQLVLHAAVRPERFGELPEEHEVRRRLGRALLRAVGQRQQRRHGRRLLGGAGHSGRIWRYAGGLVPAPRSRALPPALRALTLVLLAGCAPAVRPNATIDGRLRFVASQATQASWSFRVDDHARGGELLVDGRPRDEGCARAGRELRCELRGLFPGGHVVELRLPGALLRRSVLIGKPWPERPVLVRAASPEEAAQAVDAGADGVILDARNSPSAADLSELVDVVHAHSARAVVAGDPRSIESAGADALLGDPVPPELTARFPEARTLVVDGAASHALDGAVAPPPDGAAGHPPDGAATHPSDGAAPHPLDGHDLDALLGASGLVEARGLSSAALALAAPHGAIVERAAFPLLSARKRHASLRTGAAKAFAVEPGRVGVKLEQGRDEALVLVNAADAPWSLHPPALVAPQSLVGAPASGDGALTVAAHDVSVLLGAPPPGSHAVLINATAGCPS